MFRKLLFVVSLTGFITLQTSSLAAPAETSMQRARVASLPLRAAPTPERIYQKVWSMIKEDFYDGSFNGQDWNRWRGKYDGMLETSEDAHKAIETMLASLGDRYTRFLDEDAFDDEKSQIKAELCGIGVKIGLNRKSDRIYVIQPIEGTPAERAGVKAGDEIYEIDGSSTKGFTVDDAAKKIRGEINKPVWLTVSRHGKHRKIKIVRGRIPLRSVETVKMLSSDIGYIRISSFISKKTDDEVVSALEKLSGARGMIVDLRDNPGGLLNQAINVSNLFLDSGYVVSTVDREGYKTPVMAKGHPLCRIPMAVLINRGSASASEITSGALKDNSRAVLVGERTFGKGLVQGINRLEDGCGVNVTIAKYLTPNDCDIDKKGIHPDFEVKLNKKQYKDGKGPWFRSDEESNGERTPEDMKDLQLKKAFDVIKSTVSSGGSLAMQQER